MNTQQQTFLDEYAKNGQGLDNPTLPLWMQDEEFRNALTQLIDMEAEIKLSELVKARDFQAVKYYLQRYDTRRGSKPAGNDFVNIVIIKDGNVQS